MERIRKRFPPSIHAELSIRKKGRISRRNGKRRPEYSKAALYDVLQSHHDPRLSFLRRVTAFATEQNSFCSEALQFSSSAGDINLPYELRRVRAVRTHTHTHTHTHPSPREIRAFFARTRSIFIQVYIYTRDARVSQSLWWMVSKKYQP